MCEVSELTFFADKAGYHINGEFPSTANDPYPLMQYTGLKDKNGKEIYEGDVVRAYHGEVGEIRFVGGKFVAVNSQVDIADIESDEFEIIGDIYQHPHLLTNEK